MVVGSTCARLEGQIDRQDSLSSLTVDSVMGVGGLLPDTRLNSRTVVNKIKVKRLIEKLSRTQKWKKQKLEQREHVKAMIAKFEAEKEAKKIARELERNPSYPAPHSFHPSKAMKTEFYRSWDWRKLRNKAYAIFGHSCAQCNSSNKHLDMCGEKVRLVVDHIYPLHTHWHMRLDPSNVQVLCDECNMGKGAWDTSDHRELGYYGIPIEILEQMKQT